MWILLVTWFLHGTPDAINSYQVSFSSMELCETARQQIFAEENRLRNQYYNDALAQEKATPDQPHSGYVSHEFVQQNAACHSRVHGALRGRRLINLFFRTCHVKHMTT